MLDLSEARQRIARAGLEGEAEVILAEILTGPAAWSPLRRLQLTAAPEQLEHLVELGWLEVWGESPDGPALTLTPWAAGRLEVRLVERRAAGELVTVWGDPGEPDAPDLCFHILLMPPDRLTCRVDPRIKAPSWALTDDGELSPKLLGQDLLEILARDRRRRRPLGRPNGKHATNGHSNGHHRELVGGLGRV